MEGGKVILVTAYGRSKEEKPLPAWKLYKSPRIRYLKRKADSFGIDLYILSAEYGLVHSEEVISPYDTLMDWKRSRKLIPVIGSQLKRINPPKVVYYRGGARREYLECIREACLKLGIDFASFGYGNLGEVSRLEEFLDLCLT